MIVDKPFIPLCHIGLLFWTTLGSLLFLFSSITLDHFIVTTLGLHLVITLDLHIVITLDLLILNEWGVEYLSAFLHPSSAIVALGLFAPLVT